MKLIQEVMRISHDFVCCVGCCWCATDSSCGYEVKIEAPIGNVIGYAKQQYVTLWYENDEYYQKYFKKMFLFPSLLLSIALTTYDRSSKWKPHIRVFDANRQPMYVVRGPCCWGCQNCFCTDDIDFPVSNGRSVGMVLLIKIHISLENFINLENWIIKKLYNYLIWLRIGDKHWFRCMVFFS